MKAFEIYSKNVTEVMVIIGAESAGKAKYIVYKMLCDADFESDFTDLICKRDRTFDRQARELEKPGLIASFDIDWDTDG